MLQKIDTYGRVYLIKHVYCAEEYKKDRKRIQMQLGYFDINVLEEFIKKEILDLNRFSIATVFPQHKWEYPLLHVWDVFLDEMLAGMFLGKLVQDILIKDSKEWKCTKTDLNDRGFDTQFYWR